MLTILFLNLPQNGSSQCPWLYGTGAENLEDSWDIAVDDLNNIYVAGQFNTSSTIGGVALTNSYGARSLFVLKLDPGGNPISVLHIEGDGTTILPPRITYLNGNLYLASTYNGTLYANGNFYTTDLHDPILLKVDLALSNVDVLHISGPSSDRAYGILSDPSTNTFLLSGSFTADLTFGTQTVTATASRDGYIARFDENFNLIWLNTLESPGLCRGWTMDINTNQDIYLSGFFQDEIFIDGISFDNPLNDTSPFLAKFDANGTALWIEGGESVVVSGFSTYYDVAVDPFGGVYVTGALTGAKIFDGNTLDPVGGPCFLIKYDDNGNYQWARQEGLNGPIGFNWASGIRVDDCGSVFWIGNITSDVTSFGGYPLPALTTQHTFYAIFDGIGILWSLETASPNAGSSSYALELDQDDQPILGGIMFGGPTYNFGNNSIPNPTPNGNDAGIYIYKSWNPFQ